MQSKQSKHARIRVEFSRPWRGSPVAVYDQFAKEVIGQKHPESPEFIAKKIVDCRWLASIFGGEDCSVAVFTVEYRLCARV